MRDIKPQYITGANCYENSIITITRHYRNEYELLLGDVYSLDVSIDKEYTKLSDTISFPNSCMLDKMDKYYGIRVQKYTNVEVNTIIDNLNHSMLLIEIDAYYCPHAPQYHKYHNKHACLAIKNTKDSIICLDANIGTDYYEISFNDVKKGVYNYYTFTPTKHSIQSDIFDELKRSIQNISDMDIPKNVILLKNSLSNIDLLNNELANYDRKFYTINPFILKLSQIGGRRILYSKFIDYYACKTNNMFLYNTKELLSLCASKWYAFRADILIAMFNASYNSNTIKKLQNILDGIYLLEIQIIDSLKKFEFNTLKSSVNNDVINIPKQHLNKQLYMVDMHKYFNNHGLCTSLYDEKVTNGLTYNGEIFCDESFKLAKTLECNGIKYHISNQIYNNISCEGQEISVLPDIYDKICILGCEENGCFSEYIKLHYLNSDEYKLIQLSNWTQNQAQFNDKLAFSFNVGNIYSKKMYNNKYSLYSLELEINESKPLLKISLPDCKYIHVFAITLIKNKTGGDNSDK